MQYLEKIFSTKRKRQERHLLDLGIGQNLRREKSIYYPNRKNVLIVEVDGEKFLEIVKSMQPEEIVSEFRGGNDTVFVTNLHAHVGEDVVLKTLSNTPLVTLYGPPENYYLVRDLWTELLHSDRHGIVYEKDASKQSKWYPEHTVYKRVEHIT